jgi:ketosteroid isomerase-like protein
VKNEQGVLEAAAHLVSQFATHDFDGYFSCFADDTVFIFYTTKKVLKTKKEYQEEWRTWEKELSFSVRACSSTNQRVQMFEEMAIFSHDVSTTILTNDGTNTFAERETIVFHYLADKWIAVHEHLSPMPE